MSRYQALAEKRFRQYKWEKRKAALDQALVALAVRIFENALPVLQQTGLAKRRSIEKVNVE